MPVTIKSSQVKVKGTDGYVGIDALADSTTASRVAAITSAGATVLENIQEQGTSTEEAVAQAAAAARASIPGEYTQLSDDVSELKSAFDDIDTDFNFAVGLNLIDFSKILNGYELTNPKGNTRTKPGWYVTDWIEVKPSTIYTVSGISSFYRAEVDETKTVCTGTSGNTATFTTSANTKYVRFNSEYSGYITPQLEEGNTATAYVPYSYSSQWKKNISEMLTESNNIFNANEAEKGKIISTSTGALSPNASYWTTGLMPVSVLEHESIISNHSTFREAYYASDKSFISYSTSSQPFKLPQNTEYVRFSFAESSFPYAERDSLLVIPYGTNEAFKNRNIVNNEKLTVIDSDLFHIGKTDFTQSASYTIRAGQKRAQTMIFTFEAYYDGTTAPTVRFRMPYRNNVVKPNFYASQVYEIKNTAEYERQEWRIPAFPSGALNLIMEITVPEGTTLHVKEISNRFDDNAPSPIPPYRLNAHLTGGNVYPANTLKGFETAVSLKYPCCVAVPKRTSDGIWVCFHDDSNVGNTLRLPDGSTLPSADASKSISDFTYAQLLGYDAGIRLNVFYGGMKVPTLAAFFELCMKTGMHPMLSVHPIPTATQYAEIKALAEKYHVLETLNIKMAGSTSNIADAYAVFGDAIESYAFDVSIDIDVTSDMVALGLNLDHARLGIEYYDSVINLAKVTNALNNGLFVACFIQYGTAERYSELLEMGVSEITDDNNNSYGLAW